MNDRPNRQPDRAPQPLYITLILDESGSMQSCKGAAIAPGGRHRQLQASPSILSVRCVVHFIQPERPHTQDRPVSTLRSTGPLPWQAQRHPPLPYANSFDPDSTANPFGRYGSSFSPELLNNQFEAGSPFRPDSPK